MKGIILLWCYCLLAVAPCSRAQDKGSYYLVWSDEFNTNGILNPELWSYEQGFIRNEELQWYQKDNAYCSGGSLIIEARQDTVRNSTYNPKATDWRASRENATVTSACVTTKGTKEFMYGRFEVRAKIPTGSGSWPAIWTLGTKQAWPSCGEIDIMEYYLIDGVPHILANVAWGTDKSHEAVWDSVKIPFKHFADKDSAWASKFHIWRMEWDKTAIRLYLDDELLNETLLGETNNGTVATGANPFMQPHYILPNLAIGGQHGGTPDLGAFPLRYEIDYIRVYQKEN